MQINSGEIDIVTIAVSIVGNFIFVKEAIAVLKVKAERLEKDVNEAFTKIRELEKSNKGEDK